MPKTEADAESDTGDSQSGGTTSNVGEEIDSDVEVESDGDIDSRSSEAAKLNESHAG